MRKLLVLGALLVSGVAFAGSLHNKDGVSHKILLTDSDSCFSGTHSSIGSNTIQQISSSTKFICVEEAKPAFPIDPGKDYVIEDGKVHAK